MNKENIAIQPIGYAKNKEGKHFGGWKNIVTEIILKKQWQDALLGLEDYSHAVVVFWMSEVQACELRHVPQGKKDVPVVGIFACRCVQRPNHVGVSTVKILKIKDNVVTVQGLDVINNTPIIDIKPYTPQYDLVKNARVPKWINKLEY